MTEYSYQSDREIHHNIVNGFTQLVNGEYDHQPLDEIFDGAMSELGVEANQNS